MVFDVLYNVLIGLPSCVLRILLASLESFSTTFLILAMKMGNLHYKNDALILCRQKEHVASRKRHVKELESDINATMYSIPVELFNCLRRKNLCFQRL